MHVDWQHFGAMAIVAAAAFAVGRRLWSQIAAFRSKPSRTPGGGCGGCSSNPAAGKSTAPAPLLQIQARPPAHLRRPPTQ